MLIITRRIGETLILADHIQVYVLSIDNFQVKLGIQAAKEITIKRKEKHHLQTKEKTTTSAIKQRRFYLGKNYPGIYLTLQEARCMKYFLEGCTYYMVGIFLQLSPRTVRFYSSNMQAKLGCNRQKELLQKIKNSDFIKNTKNLI